MNRSEALRSIEYDFLEYIQKQVSVDFDNVKQAPISFLYNGKAHAVTDVLGRFKMREIPFDNAFLVCTEAGEVYFLYFHYGDTFPNRMIHDGCWILSFRIYSDNELMAFYREDRKMLVDITFKPVVDFHGHLCPDIVIGGKLCEYIQKLVTCQEFTNNISTIIAENCTSALDAIQIMLGATVGNQRLKVMDFGKHNYTVIVKNSKNSFRLSLAPQRYGDEDEYNRLEQKMLTNKFLLDDVLRLQLLLDERVKILFNQSPEVLFKVERIERAPQTTETASVYLTCHRCKEQVLRSRVVEYRDEVYCIPCFQNMNTGCPQCSLQ